MKSLTVLKTLAASAILAASPAFADLIYSPFNGTTGTGLGSVETLITLIDNGSNANGTSSACVSNPAGNSTTTTGGSQPAEVCVTGTGVEGGDNQAINNVYLVSDLSALLGISNAGQIGLIVNVNEPGNDNSVILEALYMALYPLGSAAPFPTGTFEYTGPDLTLTESGGIGQSGKHLFVLDATQAAIASGLCPAGACIVGGGVEYAPGSASSGGTNSAGGIETIYLARAPSAVPEPMTLALFGIGLLGIIGIRRRKA